MVQERDIWPQLFDSTDVARTIVSFLPWLQYIQWIIECDDNGIQARLCYWQPNSYLDDDVQKALILHKNASALKFAFPHYGEMQWDIFFCNATPDLLVNILQNLVAKPVLAGYMLCDTPLTNLQIITDYIPTDQETHDYLIQIALTRNEPQKLMWMLNEKQWFATLDMHVPWSDELWSIFEPSVVARRVTCSTQSMMPWQMLSLQIVPTMSVKGRHDLFRDCADKISFAAILWQPEFHFNNAYHFNPKTTITQQQDLAPGWRSTPRDFIMDMYPCETALEYLQGSSSIASSHIGFKSALRAHIHAFLFSLCTLQDRICSLKRACMVGARHIAEFIWKNSDDASQKQLLPCFVLASTCANAQMFEFAFDILQRNSHNFEDVIMSWHNDACALNNVMLWTFLVSKNVFCFKILQKYDCEGMLASKLGRRDVQFIQLLWPTHKHIFMQCSKALFANALDCHNIPLLQFLCKQECFQLNQTLLKRHILLLANHGIVDVLQQIKCINLQRLYTAYVNALDVNTIRTLWNLKPHTKPNSKLFTHIFKHKFKLTNENQVQNCVFFVRKELITLKDLHATLYQSHSAHVDKLFASLYFDFDFDF